MAEICYRPMTADDIGKVPLDCHGGEEALAARIEDLGSAAILAFDGEQHVGQLQFRRHVRGLRSPNGIHSPDYWGDFGGLGPELPSSTLGVFCFHVGQLTDGFARDVRYFGRGIGVGLLDHFLSWAETHKFEAVVAKSVPPDRAVMTFMGGQPARVYTDRGFDEVVTFVDPELHKALLELQLIGETADRAAVATVGMCVRHLT